MMNQSTQRTIFRWIHLFFSIPILGYIYSPFEKLPDYAPATRFFFLPVMVLTGLWMWKGHVVRRLCSKGMASIGNSPTRLRKVQHENSNKHSSERGLQV